MGMVTGRVKGRVGRAKLERSVLTGAAAFALWAFLLNHWIINWVDSGAKKFAVLALAIVLAALAFVPVLRGWRGPWGGWR